MKDQCDVNIVHQDIAKRVKDGMFSDDKIIDLAELFKVFGDSTRVKIICALLQEELCVCDLAFVIDSSVSAVSHQLRILKQSKLVKFRKEGKTVYYSLDDHHILEIIQKGCEHIDEI